MIQLSQLEELFPTVKLSKISPPPPIHLSFWYLKTKLRASWMLGETSNFTKFPASGLAKILRNLHIDKK